MHFTIVWDQAGFDQMNAIVLWHPARRAELAAALRSLDNALHTGADTWGESRGTEHVRLGHIGPLSVLIRVEPDEQLVYVMEVRLRPPHAAG